MGQEQWREDRTVGWWHVHSMAGWKDGRMRGQVAGGKKKDGERKKTKPYTTIPSRGFALSKLPLDRPHQGAAMLAVRYP